MLADMTNLAHLPIPEPTPAADRLTRNINYVLNQRGHTKVDLGNALGLTQSAISRRANGKTDWTPDDIARTARFLRVGIELLFNMELPHLDSNQEPAGYKPTGELIAVAFGQRRRPA